MGNCREEVRDRAVSIAKAIAIILMVMAHSQCPQWLWSYIYMFHMPLFFFFSGYCFKTMYLDNPWHFTTKRVIGIYWPYVKWGLVFLSFHNVFFHLNIYNDEFGFRGEVSQLYDIKESVSIAMSIMTRMKGEEQLLGAYWFLHTLFFASFIFYLILFICNKMRLSMLFGGILIPVTMVLLYTGKYLPYWGVGARETCASVFILTGYYYKKNDFHFEDCKPWIMMPVCALCVAAGTEFWWADMFSLTLINLLPYMFTALAGILMVFMISKKLLVNIFLQKFLVFVGNNTLFILTWHFLSFKIVSLLIIWIYSLPIRRLAEFPVIDEYACQGWWCGYMIIGISLPILFLFSIYNIREKWNYDMLLKRVK